MELRRIHPIRIPKKRVDPRARKTRVDKGSTPLTPRDLAVLAWVGEMYVARFDQVKVLLERNKAFAEGAAQPSLTPDAVRKVITRWLRRGVVGYEKILANQSAFVWLTRRGLREMGFKEPVVPSPPLSSAQTEIAGHKKIKPPVPVTQTVSTTHATQKKEENSEPVASPARLPDTPAQAAESHDTVVSRYHDTAPDTVIPRYHDSILETTRRATKQLGKEAAVHRYTMEEKRALRSVKRDCEEKGVRTSENEITRISINYLLEDYRLNGDKSILAQVLEMLNS